MYPSLAFLINWNLILFRMIKGWTISLLIQNMASTWITFLIRNTHVFYLSKQYLLVPQMYYIWVQISNDRMHLISGRREYLIIISEFRTSYDKLQQNEVPHKYKLVQKNEVSHKIVQKDTYWAHSANFPKFWFSRMAKISCLFSSKYCKRQIQFVSVNFNKWMMT